MERGCGNGNEKRRTGNGERGTGNGERGTGNGERGTRNEEGERGTENGKMKNSKQNQNRERVIKLLKVHEFNFGFVPTFQLLVSYAHSPVSVSGFCIIPLKRSK